MSLQVIEGTWEEIERRKAELIGRQLRVTILPDRTPAPKTRSKEGKMQSASPPGDADIVEALAFYNKVLRPVLEPSHIGDNVAIHVKSQSYEVSAGPGHARRALRARHPDGTIVVHKIGPTDHGLLARMRGEREL